MQLSQSLTGRKIIAGLLLGLFLFIGAEKAFHAHAKKRCHSQQAGLTTAIKKSGCTICDFQLAKDCGLPELIVAEPVDIYLKIEPSAVTTVYTLSSFGHISDRAPPVC